MANNIKISELPAAEGLNSSDLIAIVQKDQTQTKTTAKTAIGNLAENINYNNLSTDDKTIIGAINEVKSATDAKSVVAANPETASNTLEKITINGTNYNIKDTVTTVTVNQTQQSGTEVGGIEINGTEYKLYAPTPTEVTANPQGISSTNLEKINIGGSIYNIPSGGSQVGDLGDLDDVTITSPIEGQVLKYDSTNQVWINANESGGSGGHTILDNSGTALTQRDDLQFIGAYVNDDSTNEITKVNVVREMTKAQFDLLSNAEKVGLIRVTDEDDGIGSGYRETVLCDTATTLGSGTTIILNQDYTDFDAIYIDYGPISSNYIQYRNRTTILVSDIILNTEYVGYSVYDSGNYGITYKFTDTDSFYGEAISVSAKNMQIYKIIGLNFGGNSSSPLNYSTNEQKTGQKWIDGKDIYQRTYVGTLTSGDIVLEDFSNKLPIESYGWLKNGNGYGINLSGFYYDSTDWWASLHINPSNNLVIRHGSEINTGNYYITVKYIKTT